MPCRGGLGSYLRPAFGGCGVAVVSDEASPYFEGPDYRGCIERDVGPSVKAFRFCAAQ